MLSIRDYDINNINFERKIIIYGAGAYGELCLKSLKAKGVETFAFADRRDDMKDFFGVKVIKPEEIKKYEDVDVLIASANYIKAIVDTLRELKIDNYYSITSILNTIPEKIELSEYAKGTRKNPLEYEQKINDYENSLLSINNVDLVVTQICNLRCKDCGSLIPYYKNPHNLELSTLIRSFDKFLSNIDYLNELRILGGETFIYPNLKELVDYYIENVKIGKIVIYSNGVLELEKSFLEQFKNKKILIRLSNYGKLSRHIDDIVNLCKQLDIEYETLDEMKWRDMGGITRRNYTSEQVINVFEKCENAKCPSFYEGKLFICPRAAHGEKLGYFVNGEDEYIDFSHSDDGDSLKNKIEKMLFERNFFQACYYCNGNNRWENEIPAAIQMRRV